MSAQIDFPSEKIARASRRSAIISFFSFILIFAAFGYIIYQFQVIQEKERQLANLNKELDELYKEKVIWNENLKNANRKLSNVLNECKDLPESKKEIVQEAENAKYQIGFYGFNIDPSKYKMVKNYLTNKGFTIIRDSMLSKRPSWLSKESTILYYDDNSLPKAKQIAEDLGNLTGTRFSAQKGSGLGVPEKEKSSSFRIHYIG